MFGLLNAKIMLAAYIILVIIIVIWVENRSRSTKSDNTDQFLAMLDWFETRGLGTFFHLLVFLGILLLAAVGWRIPAEINYFYGETSVINSLFPIIEGDILAKTAQVIGAVCFGFIGLRAMRFFVPIFVVLFVAIVVWLSASYIFAI